MSITKELIKQFRGDFAAAVAALESKYGVTVTLGNVSFSSDRFSGKLEVVKQGAVSQEVLWYQQNEKFRNWPPLGTQIIHGGKAYVIAGLVKGGRSVQVEMGGKTYRMPMAAFETAIQGVRERAPKLVQTAMPNKSLGDELIKFCREVNELSCKQVDAINVAHKAGKSLFGATHVEMPSIMLQPYFLEGLTPGETLKAIAAEAEAEGRAEAAAS